MEVRVVFRLVQSEDFRLWRKQQPVKVQTLVDARLDRLQNSGHWGFINRFDGIIELKWKSGLRVYTFIAEKTLVVILLGGNKNGQSKDIKKAKILLAGWFQ